MSSHWGDVKRRFDVSEVKVATWRDPTFSVLPARARPSLMKTISAADAAKPYVPTYKYKLEPPKPPEPTDDEASDGDTPDVHEPGLPSASEPAFDAAVDNDDEVVVVTGEQTATEDPGSTEDPSEDHATTPDIVDAPDDCLNDETSQKAEASAVVKSPTIDAEATDIDSTPDHDLQAEPHPDEVPVDVVASVDDMHPIVELGACDSSIHGDTTEAPGQQLDPVTEAMLQQLLDQPPSKVTAGGSAIDLESLLAAASSPHNAGDIAGDFDIDDLCDTADKRVSFAPGTPEPKLTVRKKKGSSGSKTKKKKKSMPTEESPDDIVAIVDEAVDNVMFIPPEPSELDLVTASHEAPTVSVGLGDADMVLSGPTADDQLPSLELEMTLPDSAVSGQDLASILDELVLPHAPTAIGEATPKKKSKSSKSEKPSKNGKSKKEKSKKESVEIPALPVTDLAGLGIQLESAAISVPAAVVAVVAGNDDEVVPRAELPDDVPEEMGDVDIASAVDSMADLNGEVHETSSLNDDGPHILGNEHDDMTEPEAEGHSLEAELHDTSSQGDNGTNATGAQHDDTEGGAAVAVEDSVHTPTVAEDIKADADGDLPDNPLDLTADSIVDHVDVIDGVSTEMEDLLSAAEASMEALAVEPAPHEGLSAAQGAGDSDISAEDCHDDASVDIVERPDTGVSGDDEGPALEEPEDPEPSVVAQDDIDTDETAIIVDPPDPLADIAAADVIAPEEGEATISDQIYGENSATGLPDLVAECGDLDATLDKEVDTDGLILTAPADESGDVASPAAGDEVFNADASAVLQDEPGVTERSASLSDEVDLDVLLGAPAHPDVEPAQGAMSPENGAAEIAEEAPVSVLEHVPEISVVTAVTAAAVVADVAPPSPTLSRSSKRRSDGWSRPTKKPGDSKAPAKDDVVENSKRNSRSNKSGGDAKVSSRRHAMSTEEDEERRKRRRARKEEEAAKAKEDMRRREEEEEERRLRHDARRAARKAAIKEAEESARRIAREEAEAEAKKEAEARRRKRERRDSGVSRSRDDRTSRPEPGEKVRPTLLKAFSVTSGSSRTSAGLLVRTSSDAPRSPELRRSVIDSASPRSTRDHDPSRPRSKRTSTRSRHHEEPILETPATPTDGVTVSVAPDSPKSHRSHRSKGEDNDARPEKPHRSRRDSERRERRPTLDSQSKRPSLMGSLMRAFK